MLSKARGKFFFGNIFVYFWATKAQRQKTFRHGETHTAGTSPKTFTWSRMLVNKRNDCEKCCFKDGERNKLSCDGFYSDRYKSWIWISSPYFMEKRECTTDTYCLGHLSNFLTPVRFFQNSHGSISAFIYWQEFLLNYQMSCFVCRGISLTITVTRYICMSNNPIFNERSAILSKCAHITTVIGNCAV